MPLYLGWLGIYAYAIHLVVYRSQMGSEVCIGGNAQG